LFVAPPVVFTVITTSALALSALSLPVSRNVYDPAAENVAVVAALDAEPNVTVPGPLTFVQLTVKVLPLGNPSSLAVPARMAVADRLIVWFGPAFTTGAWFVGEAGFTEITTSALVTRALSLAVSRRVYVPAAENVAVVEATDDEPNATVPGPLIFVQLTVRWLPLGNPSSLAVPDNPTPDGSVIV
jgi:hypothetical protein